MIMWNKIIKRFLTFVPIILPNGNKVKPLYKFLQNIPLVNFSRKRIDIKRTLLYNLISDIIRKEQIPYVFGRLSYSQ